MLAEHLGINEEIYEKLNRIVPLKKQIQCLQDFNISGTEKPLSKVNLLIYIDKRGRAFLEGKHASDRIARAIYDSMDIKGKLEIMKYLEDIEEMDNGQEDL